MKIRNGARRGLYVVAATVLTAAAVFSGLIEQAQAAQVTTRSIRLSNSTPNANNVIYRVAFTVATTGNIGGIAIDFCSNTPIIGDACTAPTAFDVNESTLTVNSQSGIANLTVDSATTANKLILTRTPVTSLTANDPVSFELGNGTNAIHNPSATGSFYARIYTYATAAGSQGHAPAAPTGYVDYGGVAMSTAAVINITARVMETLSFCVYDATCGDDPSFTLGHAVGTTTVIDDTAVDTDTVNFSISTNANGGAAIRLKGDTLKSGSNDINARSPAGAIAAGTEHFGLYISSAGTNISATSPYTTSSSNYALIVTGGGGDDVTSTYGGQIASLSGPVNGSVTTLTFGATASTTTPAGTYTATELLIATGTF